MLDLSLNEVVLPHAFKFGNIDEVDFAGNETWLLEYYS